MAMRYARQTDDILEQLSHEIHSPIAKIQSLVYLADQHADRLDAEDIRSYARRIGTASARLHDALAVLFDLTASQRERLELDLEPADPVRILESVLDTNRIPYNRKGTSDLPQLVCDRVRISRIFSILTRLIPFGDTPLTIGTTMGSRGLTIRMRCRIPESGFLDMIRERHQAELRYIEMIAGLHGGGYAVRESGTTVSVAVWLRGAVTP